MNRTLKTFCLLLLALPLALTAAPPFFVANEGQWDAPFSFKAQIGSATYYVTSSGMTIDLREYGTASRRGGLSLRNPPAQQPITRALVGADCVARPERIHHDEAGVPARPESVRGHVLKMNFVNGNLSPEIVGEEKLASYSNYFLGRDSCNWRGHVGHYQKVILREVWPGIDVELIAQPEGVETVYHVAPFADPSQIQIEYEGLDAPLSVDANGCLLLQTSLGVVREKAPWAWQGGNLKPRPVGVTFKLVSTAGYQFRILNYDSNKELILDPLVYSSLLGGSGSDFCISVAKDHVRNVYVAGEAYSEDFPTTPGAYQDSLRGEDDCFISKFGPNGYELFFSTYWGGSDLEGVGEVLVSENGECWLIGSTSSSDLPLTPDAIDTAFGGNTEGYVTQFSATGDNLLFSTYWGGDAYDAIQCGDMDSIGRLYIGGETFSLDFFLSSNAISTEVAGGFVTVFDTNTRTVFHSTYWGSGYTASVDQIVAADNGYVWIGGKVNETATIPITPGAFQETRSDFGVNADGFIAKLDLQNSEVEYASYLGGEGMDWITDLYVQSSDTILLSGLTDSPDFPVTANAFDTIHAMVDGFVMKLHLPSELVASTLAGGSSLDHLEHVDVADDGSVVVLGESESADLPLTSDAWDSTFVEPYQDLFIWRLSPDLSELRYGTLIGGNDFDNMFDATPASDNSYWLVGLTWSLDFPRTPDAFMPNAFPAFYLKFQVPGGLSSRVAPKPVPSSLALNVYPNPFNPTTTISLSLSHRERVQFQMYDLLGQRVAEQDWGMVEAGEYRRVFDGAGLASGVYVMRVQTGEQLKSGKMVMVR